MFLRDARQSTGSEDFTLSICFDAIKFVLLGFFTLEETISVKIWGKPLLRNVKSPLPVDLCHSKTPSIKLFFWDQFRFLGNYPLTPPLS